MDITKFIPTKNRTFYLKRTLNYYSHLRFEGQIIVLDGSDEMNLKKNINLIKKLKNLKINHIKTSLLPLIAIKDNVNLIKKNYCSFMGDDDYLIPSGIKKSIDYLKNNRSFHSAHGLGIIISHPLNNVGEYTGPELLSDDPFIRFKNHFTKYATPFFSVTRSEDFIKIFNTTSINNDINFCKDRLILDEFLISALYATSGKIKRLNFLHIVREHHKARYKEKMDWEKKISSNDTKDSIKYFTKVVSDQIAIDNNNELNYKEIAIIIKKSVTNYYKSTFNRSKRNKLVTNNKIKEKLITILKIMNIYKFIKSIKNIFKNNELSLDSLLNKRKKYFKDFIVVYNSFKDKD